MKYIIDIKGEIEGDYEIIGKYEERPMGEWIDDGWHGDWAWETDGRGNCWHSYRCSLCNAEVRVMSNFCPNCGADMRGKNNDIV